MITSRLRFLAAASSSVALNPRILPFTSLKDLGYTSHDAATPQNAAHTLSLDISRALVNHLSVPVAVLLAAIAPVCSPDVLLRATKDRADHQLRVRTVFEGVSNREQRHFFSDHSAHCLGMRSVDKLVWSSRGRAAAAD